MTESRSADQMVKIFREMPGITQELQTDPDKALTRLAEEAKKQVPPRPLEYDKTIYRIVVGSLGLVVLFVVLGVIGLSFRATGNTVTVPDILTALGSAAIGALAGLLAPPPGSTSQR